MAPARGKFHQDHPTTSARAAHVRYIHGMMPGIRRARRGKRFSYTTPEGRAVRDPRELERIRSLAIPPGWRDVWICPLPNGHLQATGYDARERKQYRYHPRWREVRDRTKFHRLLAFGNALPMIRRRVERDLMLPRLPREKVLATIVRLLEMTLIRIGNEEYAEENRSFGLTTLLDRRVEIRGARLHFHFRGKSRKKHTMDVMDPRLARIVHACQEIPGQHLFEYLDDAGNCHLIESSHVNEYLRSITGEDFTAKDYRTWKGTVLAASALKESGPWNTERQKKRNVADALRKTAERMGNTGTVCRKYYVHPAVIEAYHRGALHQVRSRGRGKRSALLPEEALVLAILEREGPSA